MPRGVETGVLVVGELQVGKWAADSAAMKADVEARTEPTTTAGVLLYLRTVEKSLEIRRTYLWGASGESVTTMLLPVSTLFSANVL